MSSTIHLTPTSVSIPGGWTKHFHSPRQWKQRSEKVSWGSWNVHPVQLQWGEAWKLLAFEADAGG